MKKKAIVSVLACIMVMAAIGIGNAATPPEYLCQITEARAAVWGYTVTLTSLDGGFTAPPTRFFYFPVTPGGNAMYATALSALANANNVIVYLNSTVEGSQVYSLTLSK